MGGLCERQVSFYEVFYEACVILISYYRIRWCLTGYKFKRLAPTVTDLVDFSDSGELDSFSRIEFSDSGELDGFSYIEFSDSGELDGI